MPKWEFAALVHAFHKDGENRIWHLVKPADVEPAELEYDKDGDENSRQTRSFGPKWYHPTDWFNRGRIEGKGSYSAFGESYDSILGDSFLNAESIDGGSEPNIIFSSRDLLTLINLAGAEGWEITYRMNFLESKASGMEERQYRIMRREL